jgi:hypothetical protein
MKKKKILVTVRQFKSNFVSINVDSRIFDGDTKKPITLKEIDSQGVAYDYHLGQVSSDLLFAVQDISDKDRTVCKELDKLYPQGYEFEFYYLKLYFIEEESKTWWKELPEPLKKKVIFEYGSKMFGNSFKNMKPNKQDIKNIWQDNAMISTAFRILKPVDLNNIIY